MRFVAVAGDVNATKKHIVERAWAAIRRIASLSLRPVQGAPAS